MMLEGGIAVTKMFARVVSAPVLAPERPTSHEAPCATGPHISAIAVEKAYRKGQHKVSVLRGVNINVRRGEFLSIIGQSGSGKSTLLHLLGLLDSPDIG